MSSHSRFIPNNQDMLSRLEPVNPYLHLNESLRILVNDCPPSASIQSKAQGLLSGPTSIAYLFLWLSRLYPDPNGFSSSSTITELSSSSSSLCVGDRSPRSWCQLYLKAAHTNHTRCSSSSRSGGIQDEALAYACVKAALTQEPTYIERALRLARDQVPGRDNGHSPSVDPYVNEWLYGRAGTLYLLRLLAHWCPSARPEAEAISQVLAQHILAHDVPWSWRGKQYLGAAHGDAGILAQLLLSCPTLAPKLDERIRDLLRSQFADGQWPSSRTPPVSAHSPGSHHAGGGGGRSPSSATGTLHTPPTPGGSCFHSTHELVQFCHGAPGIAVALAAVLERVPERMSSSSSSSPPGMASGLAPGTAVAAEAAVARARSLTWERGLLTKEPNLCHGIVGNALAFDARDPRRELMMRAATPARVADGVVHHATFTPGEDAYGLLWGEAGRAWAWAVLHGRAAGFIGFSDV